MQFKRVSMYTDDINVLSAFIARASSIIVPKIPQTVPSWGYFKGQGTLMSLASDIPTTPTTGVSHSLSRRHSIHIVPTDPWRQLLAFTAHANPRFPEEYFSIPQHFRTFRKSQSYLFSDDKHLSPSPVSTRLYIENTHCQLPDIRSAHPTESLPITM